jgi:hypothetical protein
MNPKLLRLNVPLVAGVTLSVVWGCPLLLASFGATSVSDANLFLGLSLLLILAGGGLLGWGIGINAKRL